MRAPTLQIRALPAGAKIHKKTSLLRLPMVRIESLRKKCDDLSAISGEGCHFRLQSYLDLKPPFKV